MIQSRLIIIVLSLLIAACQKPIIIAPDAVLPDGSVYKGDIKDGKFHGQGKLVFAEGGYFKGSFAKGVQHGLGVLVDVSGSRFEGRFVNGRMNGEFKVNYEPDGLKYEGEMQDWLFEGRGKYISADYVYEGNFHKGFFEGEGYLKNSDGSEYRGFFKAGKYHGQGEYNDNTNRYIGEFKQGVLDGSGKVLYENGAIYEGEFKKGQYHGQGRFTDNGSYYEGTFIDGQLSGQGEFKDADGVHYIGELENWLAHGKGKQTDAQGSELIGVFDSGYLNGEGEKIEVDGARYKGHFEYGEYSGVGLKRNADNSVYEGEFVYGQYHGEGKLTTGNDEKKVTSGKWRRGVLVHNYDNGDRHHGQAELALENHQRLLEGAFKNLKASNPDASDVYYLGIAGDGSQSVFRRELEYVERQIVERYNNTGRTISLINHHDSATQYPLATRQSIASSIDAISKKMNVEQDILFMYLSSHGSKDHELYLNHDSIQLPDLSASELANMVQKSSIKWKVIIISACYSGGFIPNLEGPHTMIITASDSESTSFGCSEESEMTYFGKALFKEVIAKQPALALTEAVSKARSLVETWEQDEELSLSNPMISAPDAIVQKLSELE